MGSDIRVAGAVCSTPRRPGRRADRGVEDSAPATRRPSSPGRPAPAEPRTLGQGPEIVVSFNPESCPGVRTAPGTFRDGPLASRALGRVRSGKVGRPRAPGGAPGPDRIPPADRAHARTYRQ